MVLLAIFGFSTFTLVAVGANSFEKMLTEREDHSNMRVALSYVSTRVRQGDAENSLRIAEVDGVNSLVVSQNEDGDIYETWIYMNGNELCEMYIPQGVAFSPADGISLISVSGMEMALDEKSQGVNITVFSKYPEIYPDLHLYLQLRSF